MRALTLALTLALTRCGAPVNWTNPIATDRVCTCPELGHVVDGYMCAPPDGLAWPEPDRCQDCVAGRCCHWRPI